ncbi:MAG: hypothetical protein IKC08_10550, partial [Lentisphaeria bacterium]|nr:hypothetical protein [Lentisphaeria bacterium]
PFTLDEPVREISESLIEGSSITHSSALYSGEELFAEENGTEDELFHLFKPRSTPLSVNHDPMYMDEGVYSAEKISEDYVFVPETVSIPGRVFAGDQVLEKEFNNISEVNEQYCRKLDNMKSSLEKLLDEFCLA